MNEHTLSLEAELLIYETFKKRMSIFKLSLFDNPVMYPLSRIQVPKQSTLHYVPSDPLEIGPQVGDVLLQSIPAVQYIDHIVDMHMPIGGPIKIAGMNASTLLTDYRMSNRIIRPLGKNALKIDKSERDLVIYNYGFIPQMWKYPANYKAEYHAWYNITQTLVNNLKGLCETSERHQFIQITIPDQVPTTETLKLFRTNKSSATLKELRTFDEYMLADLVVWAGKFRENSLFSKLPEKHLGKINLLFRRYDRWVSINLGFLNGLITSPTNKSGFAPQLFELKMIRFLNRLHEASEPINLPDVDEADTVEGSAKSELVDGVDEVLDSLDLGFELGEETDEERAANFDDVAQLEKELAELDKLKELSQVHETIDEDGNVHEGAGKFIEAIGDIGSVKTDTVGMVERAEELAKRGSLSSREYARLLRLNDKYETLPDPFGSGKSITEAAKLTVEDTYIDSEVITEDPEMLDQSMTKSSIEVFEQKYIKDILPKDYLNMVSSMRRAPVAIMDHRVERFSDASNDMDIHLIKWTPAVGDSSSCKIPIPRVQEDGTFKYNGTQYRMKKQRRDLPIRKISPTDVVLSNIAGNKCFIKRAERTKFNRKKSLIAQVKLICSDPHSSLVTNASLSRVVDYSVDLPWMYTTLASEVAGFTVKGFVLNFDYRNRIKINKYGESDLKLEKRGWVLCGREKITGDIIAMDPVDRLYRYEGGDWVDIGGIEDLLEIDPVKQGIPMAELKVYSSVIPVGVALGYLIGLTNLLTVAKIKYRRILPGERQNLSSDEFPIRFKNEILIVNTRNPLTTMIMSGWLLYQGITRDYDIKLFDSKDVYSVALERAGVTPWFLKEMDVMNMLFIDPITKDLLEMMNEPTDFVGLLVRATELILKEYVPKSRKDKNGVADLYERVSGYDRMPGAMYDVLYKAMRSYVMRSGSGRASIIINPNDAVNKIVQDGTVAPVNNINPLHAMREREVITFGGDGGRSRRAMVAETRLYPEEDKGFISEASVDSGDVGIITYLAPNANIRSVRGTVRLYDKKRDGVGMLLSTPAQMAPFADGDDLKRVGFISTQAGHRISIAHGEVQSIRTGGERSLINRVAPEFGYAAKEDGVVKEITDLSITIELKSKKLVKLPLGLIHTTAEGSHYPNEIKTVFTVGEKFKKGDVITYNENFFIPSPFNNKRVDYSQGTVGYLAFREATYTYEDSSSISAEFGERLVAKTSKVKTISVGFEQIVSDMVKVGDFVDLETPLCVIENYVGDDESFYDAKTRDTLREYAKMAPPAKTVGVIASIEVRYNGDLELMSESLRKLTTASDKARKKKAESLGKPYHPGTINRFERIEGYHVEEQNAVIIVHIINTQGMTVGDKLVVANQLKSTVGEMLFGENTTEQGTKLDGIFGAISVLNRIVTSVFKIGPVNTYLRGLGEETFKRWTGK